MRALMTQKSCAVGMRNAKPGNHLNIWCTALPEYRYRIGPEICVKRNPPICCQSGVHTGWITATYMCSKLLLLYIELSNSFLIGRKRTVNFRNQRPWRHNCRLYNNHVKVTGNHVKVTSNHVMYDRSAWFPRVIMSTSRDSCSLPSVKRQKHDFQVFAFNV